MLETNSRIQKPKNKDERPGRNTLELVGSYMVPSVTAYQVAVRASHHFPASCAQRVKSEARLDRKVVSGYLIVQLCMEVLQIMVKAAGHSADNHLDVVSQLGVDCIKAT